MNSKPSLSQLEAYLADHGRDAGKYDGLDLSHYVPRRHRDKEAYLRDGQDVFYELVRDFLRQQPNRVRLMIEFTTDPGMGVSSALEYLRDIVDPEQDSSNNHEALFYRALGGGTDWWAMEYCTANGIDTGTKMIDGRPKVYMFAHFLQDILRQAKEEGLIKSEGGI
ncbi:hypothetical protein [Asticcacaulis benevestitus]|uniref:Uncharacterized protein n=1 Tax=Asticcacaulis benevestitus DSM 16100 = ATCC BAA-896 TaxID=1121022 RepID=V4P3W5_9CAUL|nr:hypothetical protein [Asticcacaulis benevestitus]ESQ82796.1 hypothetical protein ABENE_20615 [Asticcacaulis benevestitus DSM 16100 = ATCC BAA-896]